MARILITGLTGFVGSHLADYLLSLPEPHEIFGTMRWRSRTENVDHLQGRITLIECDIRDGSSMRQAVVTAKPDYIFHLAAQSSVFTSWHAPSDTLMTNVVGQINLLEAVREVVPQCAVLIPGSSEEYGLADRERLPLRETEDLHPLSPYAVSKVSQDMLAYQYARSYGLRIVRMRAFNHTGPRRARAYAESNFAWQLAEMERGRREPIIEVGNLAVTRDYSDVRDVVRAYWLAITQGESGDVYNVCSGEGRTIEEVLHRLIGMADVKPTVKVDPERLRPYDAPALVGDSTAFRKRTSWAPDIPFERTLRDILEFWRTHA